MEYNSDRTCQSRIVTAAYSCEKLAATTARTHAHRSATHKCGCANNRMG